MDASGCLLTSVIINDSATDLDVHEGDPVTVLIKNTSVVILKDEATCISGRNKVPVTVKKIEKGAVVSKISLDFSGNELQSIIVNDSVDDLHLTIGERVYALNQGNLNKDHEIMEA